MTDVDITKELPTVLSFCSGYGGIERGLDLAGFKHRVIAFSEIEAYAIANLVNKMEANLLSPSPIYTNLKTFPAYLFRDKVSLITGGYPCQPFSAAGHRKGKDDPRHLWPYIRGHIESIRPVQCFFENVEGHISLGLREVISDLESLGYRTTWGIFSAREVGAPHQRKRVYILADSNGVRCDRRELSDRVSQRSMEIETQQRPEQSVVWSEIKGCSGDSGEDVADPIDKGLQRGDKSRKDASEIIGRQEGAYGGARQQSGLSSMDGNRREGWTPEPRVGRVVDGCPDRVDRIRMLGNGVVPQTAAKAWITLNKRIEALND
jgi:DNA (cytosine-5)-methyltransferase 1|tara:strand:+ start:76 stop:1035 length:960 start_codon:yes stop_codon:yes gene_type:complete